MRRITQKGESASCDVGRDKDAESPRNAVEVFVANEVSATDAVRITEEGAEAIVASGVVPRSSREEKVLNYGFSLD